MFVSRVECHSNLTIKVYTLNEIQKTLVILRESDNLFSLLQWLSMRKQILKHKKMKKRCILKIILHNYILYKGDPTYIVTFPVNLRIANRKWVCTMCCAGNL